MDLLDQCDQVRQGETRASDWPAVQPPGSALPHQSREVGRQRREDVAHSQSSSLTNVGGWT